MNRFAKPSVLVGFPYWGEFEPHAWHSSRSGSDGKLCDVFQGEATAHKWRRPAVAVAGV